MARILLYIYNSLFILILPFLFVRLLWRSFKNNGYRKNWLQRLGFTRYKLEKSIWVHAVSVGETIAAVPLIKSIREEFPHLSIVITNMTPTGAAQVKNIFAKDDKIFQSFVPYDLPFLISNFIGRIKPIALIVMETELWPNLFAVCKRKNIPVMVANARLSDKSAKGYSIVEAVTKKILTAVHVLAANADQDANRFIHLGMPADKTHVTGNIKFDLQISDQQAALGKSLREKLGIERKIWIAASTHAKEEEIILTAHEIIKKKFPEAILILVPRHPERFEEAKDLSQRHGFKLLRRSSDNSQLESFHQKQESIDVYLGDTMGELLTMYAAADIAFIGGSLVAIGGHNMLEAAAFSKPILTGPSFFNFKEISEKLLSANAMIIVNNTEELAERICYLFSNSEMATQLGNNAYEVLKQNKGALVKHVELIRKLIPVC